MLADRAQKLGEYCRFDNSLPRDLSELAICLVGRHFKAQFEFYAHARLAKEAGLPEDIIEAVRLRATPPFTRDVETVVSELSPTTSVESVRFASGNGDLDAKLVNGIVYFRGGPSILATALGLPTAAAQHYAGQWIAIPDTNANFAAITNTLNLSTQVALLYPTGTVTIGPAQTFHGHHVWPLSGTSTPDSSRKAGVTRILIDQKTDLPVASGVVAINQSNQQFSEAASFVAWGGHVEAAAPTASVPIETAIAYH